MPPPKSKGLYVTLSPTKSALSWHKLETLVFYSRRSAVNGMDPYPLPSYYSIFLKLCWLQLLTDAMDRKTRRLIRQPDNTVLYRT